MNQEIRVHQYSGKEKGIMILGTSVALNELGKELVIATEGKAKTVEKNWPENIVSRELDASRDYILTFSIETSKGEIPATMKNSEITKTIFFIFTVVGFHCNNKMGSRLVALTKKCIRPLTRHALLRLTSKGLMT